MQADTPTVTTVGVEHKSRALSTLVTAFAADPFVRWLFPDAEIFLNNVALGFENFGGQAFHTASAYQISDFAGVALWIRPGTEADDGPFSELLLRTVAEGRLPEVGQAFAQIEDFHPKEPHWYLPLIGVDPGHQGRGLGAQLMKHALARCDADGLPACLESSNPANISLYERFGFEVIGKIQTESSPPMHPMWRPAQ